MLQNLKLAGASHVSIVIEWYQPNINSTSMEPDAGISVNSTDIEAAIEDALNLGLKIVLKPHVDLTDNPGFWRGQIGTYFTSANWTTWFACYTKYMSYIATIAEKYEIALMSVGTELTATEAQEKLWRGVISEVRSVYKGEIVYGANWFLPGQSMITWWDSVDYIGVDAYYPLAGQPNPSVSDLNDAWGDIAVFLGNLSSNWSKQIIFTEIGYESIADTAMKPYGNSGILSLTVNSTPIAPRDYAQANAYLSFFESVYGQDWLAGVYWWAWTAYPYDGGRCDPGYSPRGKPAETITQVYYHHLTALENDMRLLLKTNMEHRPAAFSAQPAIIYSNGVTDSSWKQASWSGTYDYNSTVEVYENDTLSIYAQADAFGALAFRSNTGFDTTSYSYFNFVAFGSSNTTNSALVVGLFDLKGVTIGSVSINNYISGHCSLTDTAWSFISVPLSNLLAENEIIDMVYLMNEQGEAGDFYIDQIMFT